MRQNSPLRRHNLDHNIIYEGEHHAQENTSDSGERHAQQKTPNARGTEMSRSHAPTSTNRPQHNTVTRTRTTPDFQSEEQRSCTKMNTSPCTKGKQRAALQELSSGEVQARSTPANTDDNNANQRAVSSPRQAFSLRTPHVLSAQALQHKSPQKSTFVTGSEQRRSSPRSKLHSLR